MFAIVVSVFQKGRGATWRQGEGRQGEGRQGDKGRFPFNNRQNQVSLPGKPYPKIFHLLCNNFCHKFVTYVTNKFLCYGKVKG